MYNKNIKNIIALISLGMIPLMGGVAEAKSLLREDAENREDLRARRRAIMSNDTQTKIHFLNKIRKADFESHKIMNFFKQLAHDFPINANLDYWVECIEGKYPQREDAGITGFASKFNDAKKPQIDERVEEFYNQIIAEINAA